MTGTLVPIEAEYGNNNYWSEKIVLDDKLWLKTKVGENLEFLEKKVIIPKLLKYMKNERFKEPTMIIDVLKRQGIDWPELDIIAKSIAIEMAKKT